MQENEINEVTQLAAALYTPDVIAHYMGYDRQDVATWMQDEQHPFSAAYYKGYYQTDLQLRQSIINLAIKGSSPAQTMARKMAEEAETRRHYE